VRDAERVTDAEGPYGTLIETRVRVLSWNLWHRFGPWEARRPAIAATLARLDADVICLQEVWADDEVGFAAELAAGLGLHHAYGARLVHDGVRFGNAVLSRWPITTSDVLPLPSPETTEEQRTCVRADIDGPRGELQVFSTHLNWRFDHSEVRQEQVQAICRFVAASPKRSYPAILCGDLNAEPDSDEIRMLTGKAAVPEPKLFFHDAWVVTHSGPERNQGYTWSGTNPYARLDLEYDRRIDYVLVGWPKSGGSGHILDCEVVAVEPLTAPTHPSDHFPVLATLRA
jgi:endonuclease/exonuclease/phosphatase family metal-dependent hydrolase